MCIRNGATRIWVTGTWSLLQEDGTDPVLGQQDEVAQLRAEIKELQDTVASANKDLTVAEAHAHEMQERCDTVVAVPTVVHAALGTHPRQILGVCICSLQEHERSKETMMEQLTQKLLTLQQAQETLESDFREIRTERDQALAGVHAVYPGSTPHKRIWCRAATAESI